MMSQPDLDMTSHKALLRSLGALSVFLKVVMAMSAAFGGVPDWIWKPLSRLFPKIAALEDSLFNLDLDDEALAAVSKQRAEWDALIQERFGSENEAAPEDWANLLIGATIPNFLEDHDIDFSIVENGALAHPANPASNVPNSKLLPDHPDENRDPNLATSAEANDSSSHSTLDTDACGSDSRRSPGCAENEAQRRQIHPLTEALNSTLLPDHSDANRTPALIPRIRACSARAQRALRKPTPRARPPPTRPKSRIPAGQPSLRRSLARAIDRIPLHRHKFQKGNTPCLAGNIRTAFTISVTVCTPGCNRMAAGAGRMPA